MTQEGLRRPAGAVALGLFLAAGMVLLVGLLWGMVPAILRPLRVNVEIPESATTGLAVLASASLALATAPYIHRRHEWELRKALRRSAIQDARQTLSKLLADSKRDGVRVVVNGTEHPIRVHHVEPVGIRLAAGSPYLTDSASAAALEALAVAGSYSYRGRLLLEWLAFQPPVQAPASMQIVELNLVTFFIQPHEDAHQRFVVALEELLAGLGASGPETSA